MAEDVDAPLGCQECGADLAASVSADFCSERCQDGWHRRHGRPAPLAPERSTPDPLPPVNPAPGSSTEIAERTTPTLAEWFGAHPARPRSGPAHH